MKGRRHYIAADLEAGPAGWAHDALLALGYMLALYARFNAQYGE